jgi:hypothetical protein
VEGAGGSSRGDTGCLKEGERVCSDAAQCENRGNSMDLVADRIKRSNYLGSHV